MDQHRTDTTSEQPWRVAVVDELPATTPEERDFRPVYERLRRKAIAIAVSYVGRETAKDVYQDVAVRLYKEWGSLPLDQRNDAFVIKAVINTAKDRSRRDRRLLSLSEEMEELPQFQLPPVNASSGEIEGSEILDPIVNRLPPQQQAVWKLRRQDYTYEEIAEKLGIQPRTVARHLQDATQTLKAGCERSGIRISRESALRLARESAQRLLPKRLTEGTDV